MLTVNDQSVSVSSQLTVVRKPGVRPLHRSAKPHGLVGLEVAPFAFFAITASAIERSARCFRITAES